MYSGVEEFRLVIRPSVILNIKLHSVRKKERKEERKDVVFNSIIEESLHTASLNYIRAYLFMVLFFDVKIKKKDLTYSPFGMYVYIPGWKNSGW